MPERRQAIIWTNAGILLIGPLGTNFSKILTEIQIFSFRKMHLKITSAKWHPFCLGLNVLNKGIRGHGCYGLFDWLALRSICQIFWCHDSIFPWGKFYCGDTIKNSLIKQWNSLFWDNIFMLKQACVLCHYGGISLCHNGALFIKCDAIAPVKTYKCAFLILTQKMSIVGHKLSPCRIPQLTLSMKACNLVSKMFTSFPCHSGIIQHFPLKFVNSHLSVVN